MFLGIPSTPILDGRADVDLPAEDDLTELSSDTCEVTVSKTEVVSERFVIVCSDMLLSVLGRLSTVESLGIEGCSEAIPGLLETVGLAVELFLVLVEDDLVLFVEEASASEVILTSVVGSKSVTTVLDCRSVVLADWDSSLVIIEEGLEEFTSSELLESKRSGARLHLISNRNRCDLNSRRSTIRRRARRA